MRNFIVHHYDEIDDDRVWSVVQSDIPHLLSETELLLDEYVPKWRDIRSHTKDSDDDAGKQ